MMDTYDHRQHQLEQHQPSYPHYQHHYSGLAAHSLPIPSSSSLLPPDHSYNVYGGSGPSSGPSSFSGSGSSSPEGPQLDELSYPSDSHTSESLSSTHTTTSHSNKHAGQATHSSSSRNSTPQSNPNLSLASSLSIVASSSQNPNIQAPMSRTTPLSRPLTHREQDLLAHLDRLKFFLATAPSRWSDSDTASDGEGSGVGAKIQRGTPMMPHPNTHPALNRFLLPSGEYVTCVLWSGLYHITGTDIVRALVFRFEAFGRPVRNMKKFEEGIFSDLRNLKPGTDACLEEPKSPFLDLLFKYQCIRTQKKQKVFYWFSVPHDRLFLDALERDLKREKMQMEPTTQVVGEPALSFTYDSKRTLYEQFSKAHGGVEGEGELEAAVRRAEEAQREVHSHDGHGSDGAEGDEGSNAAMAPSDQILESSVRKTSPPSMATRKEPEYSAVDGDAVDVPRSGHGSRASSVVPSALHGPNSPFFNMFSLFEGSPNYKQRRKKVTKSSSRASSGPGMQGFVRVKGSPDDGQGTGDEAEENDSEMSAAAMFDAQANMGMDGSKHEQARKQVESQRAVQAQHLALLQAQTSNLQPSSSVVSDARQEPGQQQFPNATVHPSLIAHSYPGVQPRHTIPVMPPSQPQSHSYSTFQVHANSLPTTANEHAAVNLSQYSSSNAGQPRTVESTCRVNGGIGKTTKAFVCPLFSCGRLFKRMEHLKRHLRTHTMEKPYQCDHCQRRFSRSDNLNQHIRTHVRDGVPTVAGASAHAEYAGDADVEEDELEGDGGSAEGFGSDAGYESSLGLDMNTLDVKMCEVEVGDNVQDIQGDEEGLLSAGKGINGYFGEAGGYYQSMGTQFAPVMASPDNSPSMVANAHLQPDIAGVRWPVHQDATGFEGYSSPHPSPGYSSVSAPSPQPQAVTQSAGANPSSFNNNPAVANNYRMYDYGASFSAPSHKLAFDQASLYPPGLGLEGLSSSPGPIRRHRSATPSVRHNVDNIRRPSSSSAAMGDFSLSGAASRAYHPYAMDANAYSASMTGSTHSSPAPFHAQLDYVQQQQRSASRQGSHHTHSRSNSSHLHEQMRQIINLDQVDSDLSYASAAGSVAAVRSSSADAYGDMYQHQLDPSARGAAAAAGQYYPSTETGASPPEQQDIYGLVDDASRMPSEEWSRSMMP